MSHTQDESPYSSPKKNPILTVSMLKNPEKISSFTFTNLSNVSHYATLRALFLCPEIPDKCP
jgi:hypothetical protein